LFKKSIDDLKVFHLGLRCSESYNSKYCKDSK